MRITISPTEADCGSQHSISIAVDKDDLTLTKALGLVAWALTGFGYSGRVLQEWIENAGEED
jgi:hypothetical protein